MFTSPTGEQINLFLDEMRQNYPDRRKIKIFFQKPQFDKYSLRDYCVIARRYLPAQAYGTALQTILMVRFNLNPVEGDGDCCHHKYYGVIEIKVSLGKETDMSYCAMQVRPFHCVNYYLLMFYNILDDVVELYFVPAQRMVSLCENMGMHAHVSIKYQKKQGSNELGIHLNKFAKPKTKQFQAWQELQQYRVTDEELYSQFN